MSQTLWGNIDQANNAPLFAPAQVGTQPGTGSPTEVNRAALYGNTTANAFTVTTAHATGVITGTYGVSVAEMDSAAVGQVTSVVVTSAGSGFTVRPTVAFVGGGATTNATATATAKVVAAVVGAVRGAGYVPGDVLTVGGGTASVAANVNVISVSTITGQTQDGFNGATANGTFAVGSKYSPGVVSTLSDGTTVNVTAISVIAGQTDVGFNGATANGSFVGGIDYNPSDVITLSDGATANVNTIGASNTVATFTILTGSTTGNTTNNPTLTQASVTPGTGSGFTLTLGNNNQEIKTFAIKTPTTTGITTNNPTLTQTAISAGVGAGLTLTLGNNNQCIYNVAVETAGVYTVLPTLDENVPSGGTGTAGTLDLSFGLDAVTMTANGAGYTSVPAVTIGGAGGVGAVAVASLPSEESKIPAAGWNLRTVKPNGRVQWETLVAMKSITGDGSDDAILPE